MTGSVGYIAEPYDHYGFSKGIKDWIARHNEYSSNELQLIQRLASESLSVSGLLSFDPVRRRRTTKALAAWMPLRPLIRLLHPYVLRLGFLDGRAGFLFCLLLFTHHIHIVAKQAEVELKGSFHGQGEGPAAQPPLASPAVHTVRDHIGMNR